ncbi:MAG: HAD-IIB family hydrolase [Bryobacterales bacterium]|nr:HAD-IIB family hydrolase [Bryobacterales bacterium]
MVTDLDGTLLDHHGYSWEGAREAIHLLELRGVPLIFCTSKTRAEVLPLREAIGNGHPFIVENGGAVYFPEKHFAAALAGAAVHDGFVVHVLGTPYAALVDALAQAAREARCNVRGFADATVEEVARWCEFSTEEATLAKDREYDEPFLLESGDPEALIAAIEARGLRWTRGGRFWHILGTNAKDAAVRVLRHAYESFGAPVQAAAAGDSPNDLPMLREAEYPILMPSPQLEEMRKNLPGAHIAPEPGSRGWGRAVLEAIPAWLTFNREIPRPPFEY